MSTVIHSKVVKIGNSRGIRIPRTILEQVGLTGDVELVVKGNQLIIHASRRPRQGWAQKYAVMASQGEDILLDQPAPTRFDENEWEW
ncbi:MAG: AbrB/MazE/SpoVT family DNA-binding domain-containing protein [Anaerolineae bacterium]